MIYADTMNASLDFAKQALRIMHKHTIPSTPQNYVLWYDYASNRNQDLKKKLDALLTSETAFTNDLNLNLYHEFYTDDKEAVEIKSAGEELQKTFAKLIPQLADASQNTAEFGSEIESLSGSLDANIDPSQLQAIIQKIVSETASIAEKNRELQASLRQSSEEISALQIHLQEAQAESVTDGLTRIGNRKLFDMSLEDLAKCADFENEPLSLILMDIDHFKRFNDTFGHRTGDEVLKLVGRKLRDTVKGQDVAARYGGEEFACILPNTSLENAEILANKIREKVSKQALMNRKTGEQFGHITISAGVSTYQTGESLENLVQRADEALYRAKDAGRDCVKREDN